MDNFESRIQNRFSQLAADYKKQLPQRIREIQNQVLQVKADPDDSGLREALRNLVHKIAGSGATFGFETMSAVAKEFELVMDRVNRTGFEHDQLSSELDQHLKVLMNSADFKKKESKMKQAERVKIPVENKDGMRRIIYLVEQDISGVSDLSSQLGFFGYQVETLSEVDSLEESLESEDGRLIIINTSILDDAEAFNRLSAMKNTYSFHIIYVSEDDSFQTRLKTVRAGGEAFFLLPMDISRLIDRIEALSDKTDTTPYHILIVDDDPEQVSYYAFILQQAGMITSVASDPKNVMNILVEAKPELVLMDMYMPGCNGTELSTIIRQQEAFVNIPIVFLSFETDKEKQLEAIGQGADDFITKPVKPEHLISAIRTRVSRTRNIRYFVERDSLTGLLNHTNLKEQLCREVMRAHRTNSCVSFGMIDADHFKRVNDTYGHTTGDRVLKSLSRLLQERLRRTDIIGRYGGEEFGVILLNSNAEDSRRIMDRIREDFSHIRHQEGKADFFVTFSCGIASYPEYKTASLITEMADKALYQAKEAGRNRISLI